MSEYSSEIEQFWAAFCLDYALPPTSRPFEVDCFGDSPGLANELAALILSGTKRATCGLARWCDPLFAGPSARPPIPGDLSILLDGQNRPVCVYETTDVEIKPVIEVDDQFALDEGEGDRTRDWWLEAHRSFFQREAEANGFEYSDALPAIFERFRVIWPKHLSDPTKAER